MRELNLIELDEVAGGNPYSETLSVIASGMAIGTALGLGPIGAVVGGVLAWSIYTYYYGGMCVRCDCVCPDCF